MTPTTKQFITSLISLFMVAVLAIVLWPVLKVLLFVILGIIALLIFMVYRAYKKGNVIFRSSSMSQTTTSRRLNQDDNIIDVDVEERETK